MIEVVAKLPGRSVFLAGESFELQVTYSNRPRRARDGSPNKGSKSKGKICKLAWASAQIHCQCSVSETRIYMPHQPKNTADLAAATANISIGNDFDTSFVPFKGEKGSTVLSTKPTILFCDLTLSPGESQTFTYKETVPYDAPPTFRGMAVKYSYKITIGTQKFDCPTKLLRVPFRVLVAPGLNDISVYQEPQDELKPNNPFHKAQQPQTSLLEVALEILQSLTCRKAAHTYNITNARGKVGKICLFKEAYRIGDDIVGTFDFSEGTIPCVQFSVTLQSEEIVTEECRKKTKDSQLLTSYSKHEEFCLHTSRSHISVPIPLTATPSFITDMVSLRWRLHFEFVISKSQLPPVDPPASESDSASWQGPPFLDVETMIWDLPLKVFATNPMYASSVSLLQNKVSSSL